MAFRWNEAGNWQELIKLHRTLSDLIIPHQKWQQNYIQNPRSKFSQVCVHRKYPRNRSSNVNIVSTHTTITIPVSSVWDVCGIYIHKTPWKPGGHVMVTRTVIGQAIVTMAMDIDMVSLELLNIHPMVLMVMLLLMNLMAVLNLIPQNKVLKIVGEKQKQPIRHQQINHCNSGKITSAPKWMTVKLDMNWILSLLNKGIKSWNRRPKSWKSALHDVDSARWGLRDTLLFDIVCTAGSTCAEGVLMLTLWIHCVNIMELLIFLRESITVHCCSEAEIMDVF